MKSKFKCIITGNYNKTENSTSTVQKRTLGSNMSSDIKIYQNEEAGDYVETTYKGIKVCVRENYPYYNPQNEKVYYSKEEEAEELYQISKEMTKSSVLDLDI